MRSLLLLPLAALVAGPAVAQGGPQYRATGGPFVLTDCRIETITNGTLERGTLVIEGDRIAAVGASAQAPAGATVVPCNGGTVYPGFIDGGTHIGLQEVGSLPETRDFEEVGSIHPQMRALTAVNPSSTHFPVARVAGVTTALAVPEGGLLPGTASLIDLHGYTPDQLDAGFEGVVLRFPSTGRRGRFDRRTDEAIEKATKEAMETLDDVWRQAVLYARIDSARAARRADAPQDYQPEMAALLPVVRGERRLLVEVNAARDIQKALEWLDGKTSTTGGRVRAALTGVAEGWRLADKIAEAGYPVIVGPSMGLPTRDSDRYDRTYANASLLHRAGIPVALRTEEAENVRNLPFMAGFAVAFGRENGFDRSQALEAITIVPARIFGVDAERGSLEAGKRATLFVATGDPFEPATKVIAVFIDGLQIPIVSRQTELYEEYLHRSPGLTSGSD